MDRAKKYLEENGLPNIKWSAPIKTQEQVKEGMDFPNSMAKVMRGFLESELKRRRKFLMNRADKCSEEMKMFYAIKIQETEILLKQ